MAFQVKNENYVEVVESGKPVVIDFWAEWCGPCKMISPLIDELAAEYEGRAIVAKCDVDSADEVAAKYKVRNIPTIIFIKNGELVDKQVGATTKAALAAKIDAIL